MSDKAIKTYKSTSELASCERILRNVITKTIIEVYPVANGSKFNWQKKTTVHVWDKDNDIKNSGFLIEELSEEMSDSIREYQFDRFNNK